MSANKINRNYPNRWSDIERTKTEDQLVSTKANNFSLRASKDYMQVNIYTQYCLKSDSLKRNPSLVCAVGEKLATPSTMNHIILLRGREDSHTKQGI